MATNPQATTVVNAQSGPAGGGTDICCVLMPCAQNADITPRLFGSAKAIFEQHGYGEGVEYAALHIERTRKPLLVIGLPIDTAGVIGRENKSGNSGSCVTTLSAGGDGVLAEHDGAVEVVTGGTIGSSQIVLRYSLDGGRKYTTYRLGTANSLTFPYVGVAMAFGAGTLVAGDVIHTWHGTAPKSASADWQAAREALQAQSKAFRTALLIGDLSTDTEATSFVTQWNAYETTKKRFVRSRASLRDRLPQAEMSHVLARMTGAPALTFAEVGATGDTITRASGSWLADGFAVGDTIVITGSGSNNITAVIASLSATVITLGSEDLTAEVTSAASIVAYPTLTFAEVGATGDTITRNRGSWLADGFRVGDLISVDGTASNDFTDAEVTAVSATVLTLDTQDLVAEVIRTQSVTITAGETKAAWMAALDAEFEPVNSEGRINLSAGRGACDSPFSGWHRRNPAGWYANIRSFEHDVHIPTWRKDDGPLSGVDLFDDAGKLVEWDDDTDGSAGSAARFTTLRTWPNDGAGAFIAQDLTREGDGTLLSHQFNAAVTDVACTTVQKSTEDATIGQSLILNSDGTATKDSLATMESRVNRDLALALLTDRGEKQRASSATWRADPNTLFNVPEPLLIGTVDLVLNGVVHSVRTEVRVR